MIDKKVFPVMPWNWPPTDPWVLQEMRDFGATMAGFVGPRHLDRVHEAGLQAIVADSRLSSHDWRQPDADRIRRSVAEVMAETGTHPAVFGYYLKDEPHSADFGGLAIAVDEIRRLAPGAWPYVNLLPNYADPATQMGTKTYEKYLEQFVATCRPTILSYDNYSLMEDADVVPHYWKNLEQMRSLSLKHEIPFWNIILTVAHFNYRELSSADARFQVYSTLAYGGRGLSYFTYITPSVGNYRMAPIDQFGHRTATWDRLREVTLQVASLGPTILRLKSDDVYHYGEVPAGSHRPTKKSLVVGPGDLKALVGDFTRDDGARYVMIVNKDFRRSMWVHPEFRIKPKRLMLVSPYTGEEIPFEGEQRTLAPGQGSLLRLE